jgi:hypothetical protein
MSANPDGSIWADEHRVKVALGTHFNEAIVAVNLVVLELKRALDAPQTSLAWLEFEG